MAPTKARKASKAAKAYKIRPTPTPDQRARIYQAHCDKRSLISIQNDFGFAINTIRNIIKVFKENGEWARKEGSGRPRKIDKRDQQKIIAEVLEDRFATGEEIRKKVKLNNVSERTVRREITRSGEFTNQLAAKKPFISATNKKRRLKWCLDHQHWSVRRWKRVLFSDESPYVLRFNRRRRVWRRPGEKYLAACLKGTVKHDKKIMVWGCFAAHGVGRLYRVQGILEQFQYAHIIDHEMMPSAQNLFPRGEWIFQEDNDPKHTSHMCQYLLETLGVIRLAWPAQSPDLNPIENLWAILDQRLKDRVCNSEEELFACLQEGWAALPVDILTKLAESMPNRIAAVIATRGGPTKY